MAGKKRKRVREKHITGLKYFDKMLPLFERLHEVGYGRDRPRNRRLHMDHYVTLMLLYMFNPVCTSPTARNQLVSVRRPRAKTMPITTNDNRHRFRPCNPAANHWTHCCESPGG